jgi:hypothetical protein
MTVKKAVLAQRLAELMGEGTDIKELEKMTVQKLHYEIQKLEEEPPPPPPLPPPPPQPKEKKEKSLWQILTLEDTSSEDEE